MTRPVELRIPLGVGEQLQQIVYQPGNHEYVAFGLISHARLGTRDVLLVREVIGLDENQYRHAPGHGASWGGTSMLPITERATAEGLGIVVFHAHDHHGTTRLSRDDDQSAMRLLPFFQRRVPSRPHASIVLSRDDAAGLFLYPGQDHPARREVRVRWYGQSILNWPIPPPAGPRNARYQRQELIIGTDGQETLARSTIAVVGLGGGGSHVVQQLAHLGIGTLILIDHDHAAPHNQHRLIGMTRLDGLLRRRKTSIQRRQVRRINHDTRVTLINERVPEPATIEAIKQSDLIIGCVDNLDARADLQHLASRYLIPYVDIGLKARPVTPSSADQARVAIGGNVNTYRPGDPCLWCTDFLSDEKLAEDRGHPDRAYATHPDGRPGEAQVVSMNGLLASQAVNEALQLLTGFAGTSITTNSLLKKNDETGAVIGYKKLDGIKGTLDEWGLRRRPDCTHCREDFARGDPAWSP
jgi:hypothetical protein